MVGVVVIGLVYLFLGRVPVFESGPAVLRVEGSTPLVSPTAGTISSVSVLPGQLVSADEVLVELDAEQEAIELAKLQNEFELQLLAHLRDPNDMVADRELRRLRPELERARARLEERSIRAPHDGAVQDVRLQPGDYLRVGDAVLSLLPLRPEFAVIAFLPGHSLPQLEEQMPVRLKISGYAYAYVPTRIDTVGRQAIGPGEARRYLGAEIADAIELSGPVVVVRCRLSSDSFFAWKEEYRVHDGMRATAEVEVRRERLLYRLIPGLKVLSRGDA